MAWVQQIVSGKVGDQCTCFKALSRLCPELAFKHSVACQSMVSSKSAPAARAIRTLASHLKLKTGKPTEALE